MDESTKIECVQTQLSNFNGFDAEIYTLEVGPSAKALRVQESLLRRIPFFNNLSTNNKVPSYESILLPDLDAQATADVLHFVKKGCIEPLVLKNIPDVPGTARNLHAGPHRYVRAYIAAHQLDVEDVQNSLLDILSAFYLNNLIQLEAILLLSKADLRASKLYTLLMEEMARGAQAGFYNARPLNSSSLLDDLKPDYKTTMTHWSSDDFLALTGQIGRLSPKKKRTIAVVAKINPCLFHNHITTPPCKSLKRKREEGNGNDTTPKHQVYGGHAQAEDGLAQTQAQVMQSVENEHSTNQDSPTRHKKRLRSAETATSSREETVAEEQRRVSQAAQTTETTAFEGYGTLTEKDAPIEEAVSFRSAATTRPGPARSQTVQADPPYVQVASSDIDHSSETSFDGEDGCDTPRGAAEEISFHARHNSLPDCSKDDPGLDVASQNPVPATSVSRTTNPDAPTTNASSFLYKRPNPSPSRAAHRSMSKSVLRKLRFGVR